ncbi:Crp/Fnr family transcriptional regulator [Sediminibacterium ginsengisoli]|uniref:cAMP-binding domain of CRP or a regulatory subunit of cAMP-dependent protein kinases n=1 Tax=Sediminibacterium ginsengisoli TaxID=413434 RepID=A0A1T4LCE3_9BACT|nr:Crp/Fnr family transcriptional regulator [Sediminibacterium ginsengisoli]SJZ52365.1 cAMP-binding domain of CRP or a regulatory subunit of cAMP-dependent protein kinases [Sediminibacterium ginsengisoli]
MYGALKTHITRLADPGADAIALLDPILEYRQLKKKEVLLKEGDTCRYYWFVLDGCLRSYFVNDKGAEQTLQFAIEQWWLSDFMSLQTKNPASFSVQAVEKTTVAMIERSAYESLLVKAPAFERYFRIVFQKAYAASQLRVKYLYTLSGEERYHHFNKNFPGFVQRVPQYMLASYLGFTPEFLSRIRARQL